MINQNFAIVVSIVSIIVFVVLIVIDSLSRHTRRVPYATLSVSLPLLTVKPHLEVTFQVRRGDEVIGEFVNEDDAHDLIKELE